MNDAQAILDSDRPRKYVQLKRLILTRELISKGSVSMIDICEHFGNVWSSRTHQRDLEVLIDLGFIEPFDDVEGGTRYRNSQLEVAQSPSACR
jgi:hypothetical protein